MRESNKSWRQKDMAIFFSEEPENDLWRELLQYSYKANIERYLKKRQITANEKTIDCIVGSFLQAYEYYKAARDANIQISPLLLYYGSTNLLYGMINLITGRINEINNHGMKLYIPDQMKYIADVDIRFLSPKDGGIHVVARTIGVQQDMIGYGDWKLKEFLGAIAEIQGDYLRCYDCKIGCVVMLDVYNTPEGKVEKVYFNENNKEDILQSLANVEGFSDSYLPLGIGKNYENEQQYFILRHKLCGKNISETSYSGQKYLLVSHVKGKKRIALPALMNMYIALFALSSLCRYFPERWSPFVLYDNSGERLLVKKFLYYARRMLPNYVLNTICGEVNYSFSKYKENDTVNRLGAHEVQEMIDNTVKDYMEKQRIKHLIG